MTTEATKKLLHYIIFNYNADEVLLNLAYQSTREEYSEGIKEGMEIVKFIPSKP